MTAIELVSTVLIALVIPYAVQLIKTEAISGNAARAIAIALSVVAGVVAGFITGVPEDAAGWATCIFAMIGGVQTAYTLFRGVGITSKWLDALLAVGSGEADGE